jgi:hypothetical protein
MLELEATASDDAAFLELASRLIAGAALAGEFDTLVIGHIDHWFGPRWLGFCGKMLGIAGVRNRKLTDKLMDPPFHPHRVLSVRKYRRTDSQTFENCGDVWWLHGPRSSQSNINRTVISGHLYAWYSGDTVAVDKACVMVYLVHSKWNTAWYVGFDKLPQWHLSKTVAIAPQRVNELLETVGAERKID